MVACADESLRQLREQFWWHAGSGITDREACRGCFAHGLLKGNRDPALLGGKLDGIAHDIQNHTFQFLSIAMTKEFWRIEDELKVNVLSFGLDLYGVDPLANNSAEGHNLLGQDKALILDLADI
jgi:hypothetical protein